MRLTGRVNVIVMSTTSHTTKRRLTTAHACPVSQTLKLLLDNDSESFPEESGSDGRHTVKKTLYRVGFTQIKKE